MAGLGHKDLSGRVIEAAIGVHIALGPGFLESVYENALCVELTARGIQFEQQKVVSTGLICWLRIKSSLNSKQFQNWKTFILRLFVRI